MLRLQHAAVAVTLLCGLGGCKAMKKKRACEHALTRFQDMNDIEGAGALAWAPPDQQAATKARTEDIKAKFDANFVDLCVEIEGEENFGCILDIDRYADHFVARREHRLECELDPENCGPAPPGDLVGVDEAEFERRFRCKFVVEELQSRALDPSLPSMMHELD